MTIHTEIGRVYRALARGLAAGGGGVIVVLDQDDDTDISRLVDEVSAPMAGMADLRVVVACREYEAWFPGGIESLRIHPSVRDDARFDSDPEAPRRQGPAAPTHARVVSGDAAPTGVLGAVGYRRDPPAMPVVRPSCPSRGPTDRRAGRSLMHWPAPGGPPTAPFIRPDQDRTVRVG